MSYDFDLEAAIDKIAELEAAIATPAPGITNAYGYGANPQPDTLVTSVLPAVVHVPRGPHTVQEISTNVWHIHYDIDSVLLAIEATPDQYPGDEAAANLFWKAIAETFLNDTNRRALATASDALVYTCIFNLNSYAARPWPPVPGSTNFYWSLVYTHRFLIHGG